MATLEELLASYGAPGSALAQALAQAPGAATTSGDAAPTATQDPASILASAGAGGQADQAQAAQTPTSLAGAVDFQDALKSYLQRAGVKQDPLAGVQGAKVGGTDVNLSGNARSGAQFQTVNIPGRGRFHVYYDANGKRQVVRAGDAAGGSASAGPRVVSQSAQSASSSGDVAELLRRRLAGG